MSKKRQEEFVFAPLGGVSMKRMFGGIGIFREGLMFGLQGSVAEVMKTSRLLDYFNVAPDHNSAVSQA